jgi:hypothetical protein
VSLLLEFLVLGQSRSLERAHLDPSRHMEPDIITTRPENYSGFAGDTELAGVRPALRHSAASKGTQLCVLPAS